MSQTEGSDKNQAGANDKRDGPPESSIENNQRAPTQEQKRADEGGVQGVSSGAPNSGADGPLTPLERFTDRLARFTGVLAAATVVLALATVGVFKATRDLAAETEGIKTATQQLNANTSGVKTATENLATATNELVKYAREQGEDVKASLKIAQDSVNAAVNLVTATQKVATANEKSSQTSQGLLDVAREGLEIQRVSIPGNLEKDRGRIVVPDVTVSNIVTSSGPADIKPVTGPLEARITIHNEGTTRSKDISGWAFAIVVPKGKKGSFAPVASNKIIFDFGILEARDEKFGTVQLSVSQIDIGKVTGGEEATLFVYGQINYTDVARLKLFPRKFRFQSEQPAVVSNGTLRLIRAPEGNEESD